MLEVKLLGTLVQNPILCHACFIRYLLIMAMLWLLEVRVLTHVYASNLFATEVTLIRLLDYALHNTNRRRNWLKLEVRMFMIWIARMTKKTSILFEL